jgi:hypothetical protein
LIKFLDEVKQRYPDVFRSIRRFQQYLNESCYCHTDKTKYKPHYHKEGDNSTATFFYEQYETESYCIHCQRKFGVGATGSGGDPDDDPYDSNDDDDGEWDDDFRADK